MLLVFKDIPGPARPGRATVGNASMQGVGTKMGTACGTNSDSLFHVATGRRVVDQTPQNFLEVGVE